MGAEGDNSGTFDPYEGMDRDNINYVHSVNYTEMKSLMEKFPPGWKRLDPEEIASGQPPYLHEPTGETSWKNPNHRKLMDIADPHQGKRKEMPRRDEGPSNKQVKKLRLMLQAGAPLGAVEQKAKLEGIDMALVLSPSEEKKEGGKAGSDKREDEKAVVSDNEEESPIPETLVRKYKRKIKAGVPLDRVQQLAGVETGASAEQVASIVQQGAAGRDGEGKKEASPSKNPRMAKFLRMQKAGIPLVAIQNSARLQGHDMKELEEALGVKQDDADGEGKGVYQDAVVKKEKVENKVGPDSPVSFGGMDPDNINYVHSVTYSEMQAIIETLPPGWKKLDPKDVALGQPPYLHEPSGETSFRNPNFRKIMNIADAQHEGKKKEMANYGNNKEVEKLRMMLKAGAPLGAVEQKAKMEGIDMALILPPSEDEKEVNDAGAGKKDDEKANPSTKPFTGGSHFTLQAGKVSFPSSRGGEKTHPLTDLVRKMAQTVQKTSQFGIGSKSEMVVDDLTLYHALGAIKGVQFARDEYNSTIGAKGMDTELVISKRHGFAEMATSIGMTLHGTSQVDVEGLDDLVKHIEAVNRDNLERGLSLLKDGYYDFDSIHTLYPPGSYVIAKHAGGGGVDCLCQVVWHRYTQGKTISGKPMKYFQLCCRFIVPVGGGMSTFAEAVEGIEMFEGRRSLSASASGAGLAFVPPSQNDELQQLLQRYNLRGEMYNLIACVDEQKTHSYMEYAKGCFFQKSGGGSFNAGKSSVALATSGRIVVDFDAATENGHSISIGRDDLIDGIRMKLKEYKLHLRLMDNRRGIGGGESKGGASATSAAGMILFRKIPQEYLALVWPTCVGFSLTSKSWGDVILDGLSDITFDPEVFDLLVLPPSRKRMIKALVKHTSASGFHDLVQGKGEGTCFLLHGQPGTGKTLTAEAIAESLQCPLYSISMGTLGTTADELERRLAEILELSARWNALVLLDEADSFLEARSSNSPLERNAMVSVMLRLVEYHRGILFLTSNRVESLDPAFQTRITLALHYEPLDLEGRAQVWENLLLKSGKSLDSLDLKALAGPVLNGREIKNALRLAMALAADEGGELTQDLLLETAGVVNGHKVVQEAKPAGIIESLLWKLF